jgi:hypothetical protein
MKWLDHETMEWRTTMQKLASMALAMTIAMAGTSLAQTAVPAPSPTPAPSPSASVPTNETGTNLTLTDEQAKVWEDKTVYSADDKNLGEVAAVQRDSSGKVTELHADIGGFLGIGETRVRVMPAQFKAQGDRIVLNLTGEQVKTLPKIAK